MSPIASLDPPVVAGVTLVVAMLVGELAARGAARLSRRADDHLHGQIGALQGAVLGLVGLLLAFSFSMSLARFETRRELVLVEANAIGTTWLRTDALTEPARGEARRLLRAYVDERIGFYGAGEDRVKIEANIREGEAIQDQLWTLVEGASVASPGSLPLALLVESLNDVIDLHASRIVAHDARVPDAILAMQIGLAVVGVGTVAFGFGLFRGPHRAGTLLLSMLLAGILLLISDLDQPRQGWIRVSQEAMLLLREDLDAR